MEVLDDGFPRVYVDKEVLDRLKAGGNPFILYVQKKGWQEAQITFELEGWLPPKGKSIRENVIQTLDAILLKKEDTEYGTVRVL